MLEVYVKVRYRISITQKPVLLIFTVLTFNVVRDIFSNAEESLLMLRHINSIIKTAREPIAALTGHFWNGAIYVRNGSILNLTGRSTAALTSKTCNRVVDS